ncbi:hypothetical protein [Peribacillus frigoritolerans]|uniref:hypothetical protein n=1 Tax=Peribacillus castrilensis TaxID=2897690 RepID=UPI00296EE6B5|nr:hypothetical protein [Peribacillus castrilensis]
MKLKISLRMRAIQTIIREFFIVLTEKGLTYQKLSEEADKDFLMKHFSDIDLEQLQNIVQTMKKVNASISSSKDRT